MTRLLSIQNEYKTSLSIILQVLKSTPEYGKRKVWWHRYVTSH